MLDIHILVQLQHLDIHSRNRGLYYQHSIEISDAKFDIPLLCLIFRGVSSDKFKNAHLF